MQALLKLTPGCKLWSTNCSRKSNMALTQEEEHSSLTLKIAHSLLCYVTFVPKIAHTLLSITACVTVYVTSSYRSAKQLLEIMCTKQGYKRIYNLIKAAYRGQSLLYPALGSVGKGPLLVPCDWGKPCYAMTLILRPLETWSRVDYCVRSHISNLNFYLSLLL